VIDVSDDAYSREKLAITVEVLATGTGRIQDRLRDAYISGLGRLRAEDIHVGDEAIALLEQITAAMTKLYAPQTGSVAATTRAMDDPTAVMIARDCFELYCRVFRIWDPADRPLPGT
jgi:hypothetical protein